MNDPNKAGDKGGGASPPSQLPPVPKPRHRFHTNANISAGVGVVSHCVPSQINTSRQSSLENPVGTNLSASLVESPGRESKPVIVNERSALPPRPKFSFLTSFHNLRNRDLNNDPPSTDASAGLSAPSHVEQVRNISLNTPEVGEDAVDEDPSQVQMSVDGKISLRDTSTSNKNKPLTFEKPVDHFAGQTKQLEKQSNDALEKPTAAKANIRPSFLDKFLILSRGSKVVSAPRQSMNLLQAKMTEPKSHANYARGERVEPEMYLRVDPNVRVIADGIPLRENPLDYTTNELHKLLNAWYYVPAMFNKTDYPFCCGGFVCPVPNDMITIFTRRLGPITLPEFPQRKSSTYMFFMAVGPNCYRMPEFDKSSASFKSTKYVRSDVIECKGYALMAVGNRNDPEETWFAWNDHCGFMQCTSGSSRTLKQKYYHWQPTLQMIMFDAASHNNGKTWIVKTINHVSHEVAKTSKMYPEQAYFIDDLIYQPGESNERYYVFYSAKIGAKVGTRAVHMILPQNRDLSTPYCGVVFTTWNETGTLREYHSLCTAKKEMFETMENFKETAAALTVGSWNESIIHR